MITPVGAGRRGGVDCAIHWLGTDIDQERTDGEE